MSGRLQRLFATFGKLWAGYLRKPTAESAGPALRIRVRSRRGLVGVFVSPRVSLSAQVSSASSGGAAA